MRVRGTNYLFISDFFFEFLLSLIFVFFFGSIGFGLYYMKS